MPDAPLTWEDLKVFDPEITENLAEAMIATVWSRAQKLAPCLKNETPDPNPLDDPIDLEIVRSALRAAILRWQDTGSGGVTQRTANEYSETLSKSGGGLFRPDEITDLQGLCSDFRAQKASTISTYPETNPYVEHAAWCSITFGGILCDCGAELSLNGLPLWVHP